MQTIAAASSNLQVDVDALDKLSSNQFCAALVKNFDALAQVLQKEKYVPAPADLKILMTSNGISLILWQFVHVLLQSAGAKDDFKRQGQNDTVLNMRIASILQLICGVRNRKCTTYGRTVGNELKMRGLSDWGLSMLYQTLGIGTPEIVRQ